MIIDFTADGQAQAMHRDEMDLNFLGHKSVERATEIKFNEATQKWDIQLPLHGEWITVPHGHGFASYDGARKTEIAWLDMCRLEGVSPRSASGSAALQLVRLSRRE